MNIYPKPNCSHPFVVELNGKEVGCIYLHYEYQMAPPMVWVMYLKSYSKGFGSEILKLLCEQANKENVRLYLEPVPDKGSELLFSGLVSWYRRYGFVGEHTMVREPNA